VSGPPDDFVDRVMGEVARHERRLPLVVAALAASALVLAVPAALLLLARPAFDAAFSLALAGLGEAIAAASDNPLFWTAAVVTLGWLGWLASRAIAGRG
jgi:hypothetical protein